MNELEDENQIKRMKELENKLLNDTIDDDPDMPPEKMHDSLLKYQKLKQTLNGA